MSELFPNSIAGFTEYIQIAYKKAFNNMQAYGYPPANIQVVTPVYEEYLKAEAMAADPDTATAGARRERDKKSVQLKKLWRNFLNENIRYNSNVSTADLDVFGIKPRDTTSTPAQAPTAVGVTAATRLGKFKYEVTVIDKATSKRKLPVNATGTYLYLAVSELGVIPEDPTTYRKLDFSSNAHHTLTFPADELTKQANIYACYSNRHGKEGPVGPVETFVIN